MRKKLISMLLGAALVVGSLAGCGSSSDSSSADSTASDTASSSDSGSDDSGSTNSKYKDFITVDVFNSAANYQGMQSGWFAKIVKDKFNMELNVIAPNVAGYCRTCSRHEGSSEGCKKCSSL